MNHAAEPTSPTSPFKINRFRLPQRRPSSPGETHSSAPQAPRQISKARIQSETRTDLKACHRCRRLKKKCSRTLPECLLCVSAGIPCSIGTMSQSPGTAALQARVEWLSKIINEKLSSGSPIQTIETGSQLLTGGSRVGCGHEVGPGPGSGHDHSGVAAVLASMSGSQISVVRQPLEIGSRESPVPTKVECRRFVDAYFRHVHRAYPFVERKAVIDMLDGELNLESYQNDATSTKLYLIMAIGCTTLQRAGQISDDVSGKFAIHYDGIVQQCLKKESLESVEILLLLALYSLFDPTGLSPWTVVGLLTRQALGIGITREIAQNEDLSPLQVELRHRLHWSIFVMDRMVSLSLGLPTSFNDNNAEISLPGVTIEEFGTPDRFQYTFALQVSRHIIQLRQLEEKILNRVYLASRPSVSALSGADKRIVVHDLRSQIENWYSQGCLLSPSETDNVPFHNTISWLTVRYYNLLILLHGPSHFNSELSTEQNSDLQQYIQKYVQSSTILLQQRQLPLNWITLYRFLPICSLLLYCFVRNGHRPFTAELEVIMCAEILEAFPSRWTMATRGARVYRVFSGMISPETSTANAAVSPVSTRHSAFQGSDASDYSINFAQLQELITEANELVKEVLGKSSAYNYIDNLMKHSSDWANSQLMSLSRPGLQLGGGFDDTSWQGMGMLGMDFL